MKFNNAPTIAALLALIVLQTVMLGALYAGVRPHPPEVTPLFGIAPFIGAAVAISIAAVILDPQSRIGSIVSIVAALLAAVSFGPQKYFDAQIPLIWPAVVVGQISIVVILYSGISILRKNNRQPKSGTEKS